MHDFIRLHTYNEYMDLVHERDYFKIDIDQAGARGPRRLSPSFGGCLGGWTSSLALPSSVAPAQCNGEPREPCLAVPRFPYLAMLHGAAICTRICPEYHPNVGTYTSTIIIHLSYIYHRFVIHGSYMIIRNIQLDDFR